MINLRTLFFDDTADSTNNIAQFILRLIPLFIIISPTMCKTPSRPQIIHSHSYLNDSFHHDIESSPSFRQIQRSNYWQIQRILNAQLLHNTNRRKQKIIKNNIITENKANTNTHKIDNSSIQSIIIKLHPM